MGYSHASKETTGMTFLAVGLLVYRYNKATTWALQSRFLPARAKPASPQCWRNQGAWSFGTLHPAPGESRALVQHVSLHNKTVTLFYTSSTQSGLSVVGLVKSIRWLDSHKQPFLKLMRWSFVPQLNMHLTFHCFNIITHRHLLCDTLPVCNTSWRTAKTSHKQFFFTKIMFDYNRMAVI